MNDSRTELARLLDDEMLRLLQEGREVVTKDGDVVKVRPNAADLNAIRQRINDLGVQAKNPSSKARSLEDALNQHNLRLAAGSEGGPVPPLDDVGYDGPDRD